MTGSYVAVGAQTDALAQLIHRVDLIDPVAVDVHQQEAPLHVAVVDAELLFDLDDLLLVCLFRRLGDLVDGEIDVPTCSAFPA